MSGLPTFLYYTEVDVSLDNGRGINEREFVSAFLRVPTAHTRCVLPRPLGSGAPAGDGIRYVLSHERRAALYPVHMAAALRAIVRAHRERPLDALVCRPQVVPMIPLLACRILGIPVMLKTVSLYNKLSRHGHFEGRLHRGVMRSVRWSFQALLNRSLAVDTVSHPLRRWIQDAFQLSPERIRVIPNGANLEVFRPGDREASRRAAGVERFRRVVGYVGGLSGPRHVDTLIRAVAGLDDDTALVLVGDGDNREDLERLAHELNLAHRIVFTGSVPYEQVPIYMRAFDVAVDLTLVPITLGDGVHGASFSQKIAQYLGCGLPVVAWRVEDTGFLEEEGVGSLATPGELASVTRAIQKWVRMPNDDRVSVSGLARNYAEVRLSADGVVDARIQFWIAALEAQLDTPAVPGS